MSAGLGDFSSIFGQNTGAFGGPAGLNVNNMLSMVGGVPGSQSAPNLYQPGGMFYEVQGNDAFRLPYNPNDVRSKVGQSMQAPDFASAMRSLPGGRGVAHNSPARAYVAAMRGVMPRVGANASTQAMLPLQYGGLNAESLLSQEIGNLGFDQSLQRQYQSQANQGLSTVMSLLSPFLNTMMGGVEV